MSLRLVRCPHCSRRYDVRNIGAGTRLRCGCSAILSVPAAPAPRPRLPIFRVAAAVTAGLVAASALAMALRSSPPSGSTAPAHAAASGATAPAAVGGESGFFDDPVSRLQQELRREFPASRFSFSDRSRPFYVALEASDRYAGAGWMDEFTQALELTQTVFRREVADRLNLRPLKDALLEVLVLGSRENFDRYCEAQHRRRYGAEVKGFYECTRRRIVTYRDPVIPTSVLLHEGMHQLAHAHLLRETQGKKVPATYWMQEGLGCYVESFRRRVDGEVGPDRRLDGERLPMLKQALSQADRSEFVPLPRLVGITVDVLFDVYGPGRAEDSVDAGRQAKFCYAESEALVRFLRQSGPRHRRVFDEYLRQELAGTASKELFARLVHEELGLDLYELDDQFVKYVQTLP